MKLEYKFSSAPDKPGVYLFKNSNNDVIYVGKAKSILKRLKSYFTEKNDKTQKVAALLDKVKDIQCITTRNELEALLLENNLIKRYKPVYNIRLKDDKTYPYLKLTIKELFPRLVITRKIKKNGSIYFGPFTPVGAVKESLKMLARIFRVCTCKKPIDGKSLRPCLNYQMKLCSGPCCGYVSQKKYSEIIEKVKAFLEGETDGVLDYFKREMERSADSMDFETAARYRDAIDSIGKMLEKQMAVRIGGKNQDAIAWSLDESRIIFCVLNIRKGRIIGHGEYSFENIPYIDDIEVCESFLKRYYDAGRFIPKEILVPKEMKDTLLIENWLTEKKGKRIKIIYPRRGKGIELIKMAEENALISLKQHQSFSQNIKDRLSEAKKILSLAKCPEKIEGIDVSNISGKTGAGSVVVWENGKFNKGEYRKFKIKRIDSPDDYGMISEVVSRRYKRLLDENKSLPDLVLIDGGRGQLRIANEAIEDLGINGIDVIAIAKGKSILKNIGREGLGEYSEEEIFITGKNEPLRLKKNSAILHIFQSIRDEAHRFAIKYHKTLRGKKIRHSELDKIPGIGEKLKKSLLNHFGSVESIKQSSLEELCKVKGINRKNAVQIISFLKG